MKNAGVFLLIVFVVVLGLLLYSQGSSLREQRRQVQELSAKLESMSKTASLDVQGKCARQAHEAFKLSGFEKYITARFQNHHNKKLEKCFVLIKTDELDHGRVFSSRYLLDAFEGKEYAEYHWASDKIKKFWEVPPLMCTVKLMSGEEKICNSEFQFDALIKLYME